MIEFMDIMLKQTSYNLKIRKSSFKIHLYVINNEL